MTIAATTAATAAPINSVPYGSLTVTGVEGFDSLAPPPMPGIALDSIVNLAGASYAERFAGQTLVTIGDFDTLTGAPSGPLALVAGAASQNVVAATVGGNAGIAGLGPVSFPNNAANGEGALSILLDEDSHEFGIQILGAEGGSATFGFFRRDGTVIDSITFPSVTDGYYGFARDLGIVDIAGISITNDDAGGFGFDNAQYQVTQVPEPGTSLLVACGLLGLGVRRRRAAQR